MGKKMAKRPFVEFILQLINIIFALSGLGVLGYGLLCFVKWKQDPSEKLSADSAKYMVAHRLLLAIDSSKSFSDSLPRAWFIYLLIGIGGMLLIISCFGYVGTASRSLCCLFFYCVLLVALILVEIGLIAFVLLEHNWTEVIPRDKSGNFHSVYHFLNAHWEFIRWVALAVFILQVIAMILALYLRSVVVEAYYDDEPIAYPPHVARTPNWRRTTATNATLLTPGARDHKMPRKSPTATATAAVATTTLLQTPSAQDPKIPRKSPTTTTTPPTSSAQDLKLPRKSQ